MTGTLETSVPLENTMNQKVMGGRGKIDRGMRKQRERETCTQGMIAGTFRSWNKKQYNKIKYYFIFNNKKYLYI